MDSSIVNQINNNINGVFSNITLIDITKDLVTFLACKNPLEIKESNSYEDYYEKLKKIIHPDYINKYFETISLNNLNDDDYKCIKYLKLSSNLSYDNYIDIIKKISDNQILILTFKCDLEDAPLNDDEDLNFVVTDLIVNIESVLSNVKPDSYEVKNAITYVNELLQDVKVQNKKVLQNYKERITFEVNKTHESLLIIDDDALTRNIFKKVFEKTYNIIEAKNGAEAVEIIEKNIINLKDENAENIVGMFLDLKMPIMDGFGVLDYLTNKKIINRLPVIIISADDAKETKEEVYKYNIADMLEKPFNFELIKKRVNNMVRMYAKSNILNSLVQNGQSSLKQIICSYVNTYLKDYESVHLKSKELMKKMLTMYSENENIDVGLLIDASKYYDVAISTVPRKYLSNVNGLSSEERKLVLNYPSESGKIIDVIAENQSDKYINYAKEIAYMHNERYDGLGFPRGLKKDDIPGYIYLINIAIDYANMINSNKSKEEIILNISNKSGNKYDPVYVEIFKKVMEEEK